MTQLLTLATSFPTVVFTVLVGVVLLYWGFVILGALDIDALGSAHHDAGDVDLDADVDADGEHGVAGLLEALHLRSAPATVVLSLVVVLSWLASALATVWLGPLSWPAGAAVLVASPLAALPLTALAVRPLGRVFVPQAAAGNAELVGKVCVVRTGHADATFGEATLDDGGAGLVVRVRTLDGVTLARGDEALIIAWDEAREAFAVAAMKDVLAKPA